MSASFGFAPLASSVLDGRFDRVEKCKKIHIIRLGIRCVLAHVESPFHLNLKFFPNDYVVFISRILDEKQIIPLFSVIQTTNFFEAVLLDFFWYRTHI